MAIELDCLDPWFQNLEAKYGYDFAVNAGYFQEPNAWNEPYGKKFSLPEGKVVIQYSGAFYPFHEGHLETVIKAIDAIAKHGNEGVVVIHVDHQLYRTSKGRFNEQSFTASFGLLLNQFPYRGFNFSLVFEDAMDNGCSRNFTRLYKELIDLNNDAYFLCGGDRANFSLAFIDRGKCIVAGRSSSESYKRFKPLMESERHIFIEGNNDMSSTKIRKLVKV
jgi:nicotinic acid mononucleotide adenylyltransferase